MAMPPDKVPPDPSSASEADDAHPPGSPPPELGYTPQPLPSTSRASSGRTTSSVQALRTHTVQWLSSPPRPPDRLRPWLVLSLCLLLTLIPLLVGLPPSHRVHEHEQPTLDQSVETWRQQAELSLDHWSLEPLVPVVDGQPQLDSAPGTTWFHLLAFWTLDREAAEPADLAWRARAVSIVLALLAVAAVFWAGMSIGGLVTATMAALVCLSMPLLLFHASLATPDVPVLATAVLAVAAALWAIRPLKPAAKLVRQACGWALCGISLGLAVLTGGLPNLAAVLAPLVLILVLCPHRLSHSLGLLAAAFIAALITMPWVLYVHERDPNIWQHWLAALIPQDLTGLVPALGWRVLLLAIAVLPWSVWLIAALLQPMSTSSTGSRLRMFIGWVWFVPVALLIWLAPGQDALNHMLLAVPAGALLVGQVVRQYIDLSAEGRHARFWRWLRWPHTATLLVASIVLPLLGHLQPTLVQEGWLDAPVLGTMHGFYWLSFAIALLLLIGLSVRYVLRHHPGRAVLCWSSWAVLAFIGAIIPLTHGPLMEPLALTEALS